MYKNANGLRYHLERGNCELESDADGGIVAAVKAAHAGKELLNIGIEAGSNLAFGSGGEFDDDIDDETALRELPHDIRITHKPYWCRVSGCGRRYKNLNGLKYHGKVAHPGMSFQEDVKGHSSLRV